MSKILLLETPWVEMDGVEVSGEPLIWDFCVEEDPHNGAWIEQLISLYGKSELNTLNDKKNEFNNITFSDEEVDKITNNLLNDQWFVNIFIRDFSKLSEEKQKIVIDTLPEELTDLL